VTDQDIKIRCSKRLLGFLEPKRYKILIGGRGSTKSTFIADNALMGCMSNGERWLCCREYQKSISDSVAQLLSSRIKHYDIRGFEVQKNTILYGNEERFKFTGLARNPESIQSYQDFQRVWVEEAQTASAVSFRALFPTIRAIGSEIWMSGNLRSMADPFTQRFFKPYEKELRRDGYYEDDEHLIIWINWTDNPFLDEDAFGNPLGINKSGKQIIHPIRLEEALDRKKVGESRMSQAEYDHIWKGETYDDVLGSIIPTEWFDACIDAHIKLGFEPSGQIFASYDPSDNRGDAQGFACRHGSVYTDICEYTEGDVNDGCDWATERALRLQADHFTWDGGGLGLSLKRQVSDNFKNTRVKYHKFNGQETASDPDAIYQPVDGEDHKDRRSNKDTFANQRAQRYISLADRFERTFLAITRHDQGLPPINFNPDDGISLSSDIAQLDQLRSEVCRVPRKKNSSGKKQIMSKPEMLSIHQIPSPNMADCMMMNECEPTLTGDAWLLSQGAIDRGDGRGPQFKTMNFN